MSCECNSAHLLSSHMEVEARFTKKAKCLEEEDSNILIAPSCSRVANSENSGEETGEEERMV